MRGEAGRPYGRGRQVSFKEVTMRSQTNRLRRRLLGACLAATLAVPASASAMLPAGDGPIAVRYENSPGGAAVHHSAAQSPLASSPSVVREVRTITTGGGDSALATVLAAAALGIALSGVGYVAFRLRPITHSS
jgi:hypothetical protein